MRFEVPQFIDVEDKIFGPLTWKQFVYVAGGIGAVVILFFMVRPFIIFFILATPIAALATGLAFYPINNRPFSNLLESILTYFGRSRLYLWRREISKVTPRSEKNEAKTYTPPSSRNSIASMSRSLEITGLVKK